MYQCMICHEELEAIDTYEYRGAYSCADHFELVQARRDIQRQEIIAEESAKTECFRGLPLDDSPIGKANREILKGRIEVAGKESGRLRDYEGRGV
mgnify:CR=1 FL=1